MRWDRKSTNKIQSFPDVKQIRTQKYIKSLKNKIKQKIFSYACILYAV